MRPGCWLVLAVVLVLAVPVAFAQGQPEAQPEPELPQQAGDTGQGAAEAPPARASVSLGVSSRALAEAYPDQARWLDTESFGQALVLFEKEQAGQSEGAVLILADEGQGADTQLAGALRQPLTRAGWAVMAMGLPEPPLALAQARRLAEQSPRREAEESPQTGGAEDPDPEASVMIDVMSDDRLEDLSDRYDDQIQAYLEAAVADLRAQGYERLVLVAVGRGVVPVTRQALAGTAKVDSLVWVAPTLGPGQLRSLAAQLAAAPVPVLELVSSRAREASGREHLAIMQRQGVEGFSQQRVAMNARPVAHDAGQLANRILAWLER